MKKLLFKRQILNNKTVMESKNNVSDFSFPVKGNYKVLDKKQDSNLTLYHYDINEIKSTSSDDPLRKIRGLILEDNKVIAKSYGYIPTVVVEKLPEDFNFTDVDSQKHSINPSTIKGIYPMVDGTIIRVWKHNSVIYLSTHKKIDASKSHWGSSENFTDLFLKYTKNYFNLEDLFTEDSQNVVHNFLLVNQDTLVCSKINLGAISGFVSYINSFNGTLPEKIMPLSMSIYDIKETEDTFFSIKPLETLEEQNTYLVSGFGCCGEGVVIIYSNSVTDEANSFDVNEDYSILKIAHSDYYRRSELVGNDPNILHRAWTILSQSLYPRNKKDEDSYISKFPPIPCPSVVQFSDLEDIDYKTPSIEELTKKNNLESKDLRFRNALMHYALSLPVAFYKNALECYNEIISAKGKVITLLRKDYETYIHGNWGTPNARDLKVYQRIQAICQEAKKFAQVRYNNGERLEDKTQSQIIKQFTKDNIKALINNEYGENMYKIVRVLITDVSEESKEAEEIKEIL